MRKYTLRPKRNPVRKLRPVRPSSSTEKNYRNKLLKITEEVEQEINSLLLPLFESKPNATTDSKEDDDILELFTSRLKEIRDKFDLSLTSFESVSREFSGEVQRVSSKRFRGSLAPTGGDVDFLDVIASEGLRPIINLAANENANLIKSIPQNYLNKVSDLVQSNFIYGSKAEGGLQEDIFKKLREDIKDIGPKAKKRAKLIARDQTAKLNSALTRIRQTNLGIEEYMWSNSRDARVRGNPAGLYPDVPTSRNHWIREGKVFRWDSPPPDGHPGEAINCRCVAIPVIKKEGVGTAQVAKIETSLYNKKEEELISLLESGEITTREYNKRMRRL